VTEPVVEAVRTIANEPANEGVVINGCSAVDVRPGGGSAVVQRSPLALGLIDVGADLIVPGWL